MKRFSNKPGTGDFSGISSLVKELKESPWDLPFTYNIGEAEYCGIPKSFSPELHRDKDRYEWTGKTGNGLQIRCEARIDEVFPVVDWTVWIENTGTENTPLITGFTGFHGFLPGENPVITASNGDTTDRNLYTETEISLSEEKRFIQKPDGGRGSDCALPYYRVMCGNSGYNISIGWPGQWISEFRMDKGGFRFLAKQEYTCFYLKPGEKVRSPRMTVMSFEGPAERGINLWRRFMFARIIPKNAVEPAFALSDEPDTVVFFTKTTDEREIKSIETLENNGIHPDVWWIDAGWYPCRNPEGVNEWVYTGALHAEKERFPNGLRPVSDKCHENGTKLLLWFEPERVKLYAQTDEYPSEDVLTLKDSSVLESIRLTGIDRSLTDDMGLKNLGDPAACERLTDTIDRFVKENGIDIYRQDFNFPPLHWWLQNDEGPLRKGITENFYNQGYLRFWDELLKRNPGLWINSVSSGGRRSDLESMNRSVSLHQSDYGFGQHPLLQSILEFGYTWLGFFGTMVQNHDRPDGTYDYDRPYIRPFEEEGNDNFAFHNAFCPFVYPNRTGMRCNSLPSGAYAETEEGRYLKAFRKIWERAVPYTIYGDFYLLRKSDRTPACARAIQFHDEEREEGIIQIIRNTKCEEEEITVFPYQIDPEGEYEVESPEFGKKTMISGKQLEDEGLTTDIPVRTGEIIFYRKIN